MITPTIVGEAPLAAAWKTHIDRHTVSFEDTLIINKITKLTTNHTLLAQ